MSFNGFSIPEQNFSKLPHEFIEIMADIDSLAELKVTLYILRHTWGFSEYDKPKKITTDEFESGRKLRDGSRMDRGTGLSTNSIRSGLEKAVERGTLTVEIDDSDGARIEKYYSLNMSKVESISSKVAPRSSKVEDRTEKETKERKEPDMVDFELSKLRANSIRQAFKKWPFNVNWETKSAREFMEWAVSEGVTPEQVERAADIWRHDKRFNWQQPSLKLVFEKWPALMSLEDKNEGEDRTSMLRTL